MRFDVFTLFPEVFSPYLQVSIFKRAIEARLIEVHLHNIRDWAADKHRTTDDTPFGGGGGMVMKPEPIFAAVEGVLGKNPACPIILLTPQGKQFTHKDADQLSRTPGVALICGRYEGVDERIREHLVTDEFSIGDFVLSGGELPAMMVMDAITRQIPGALGDPEGAQDDSFATGLLEYPHYTRPPDFRGWQVPSVLLSGDHARVTRWRRQEAIRRTFMRRPDLLPGARLSESDKAFLESLQNEIKQKGEVE